MQSINTAAGKVAVFLIEVEHEAKCIACIDKNSREHRLRGAFARELESIGARCARPS